MLNEVRITTLAMARTVAISILLSMCVVTAGGVLFSTGVISGVEMGVDPATAKMLGIGFLIVALTEIGLSHVVRAVLFKRAAALPDPAPGRYKAVIVSMALGETSAMLALVNGILTHNLIITILLGAAGIITGLLHFPRASMFE